MEHPEIEPFEIEIIVELKLRYWSDHVVTQDITEDTIKEGLSEFYEVEEMNIKRHEPAKITED